jgi:hypothetical protein
MGVNILSGVIVELFRSGIKLVIANNKDKKLEPALNRIESAIADLQIVVLEKELDQLEAGD